MIPSTSSTVLLFGKSWHSFGRRWAPTGSSSSSRSSERLDILEDVIAKDGDFLDNERAFANARALANVYFNDEVQKHGYGPQAAEAALLRAAADVRAYETAVAEGAIARHANQLKTLTGAASEPGSVYGQGFQERQVPDYRGEGGTVSDRIFGGR